MSPLARAFNLGEWTSPHGPVQNPACIAGRTFEATYHIDGDSLIVVSDLGIGRGELGDLPDGIIAKMLLRDLIRRHVLEVS